MNAAFFNAVRPLFGGTLSAGQVEGITIIVNAWAKYGDGNLQRLAYALATPVIETARTMQPIHEYGKVAYFSKYEPGTPIGKRLGNTRKGDGYRYRGRGYVQLTGRDNYVRAGLKLGLDLVGNPDLCLDPVIAARILIVGSLEGWFTSKGLEDYIDDIDESDEEDLREFANARRVINGQDRAVEIGKLALVFEKALKLRGTAPVPAPRPAPVPTPKPTPKPAPEAPTVVEAPSRSTLGQLINALIELLFTLFKALRK